MRKFTLVALAAMALAVAVPAQTSTTISSGPWKMRKSTGDAAVDRLWFISDRTLNAAEAETLRSMLHNMRGNTGYTLQKAILNAIDKNATSVTDYNRSYSGDWMMSNGLSDIEIYYAMLNGLSWQERGVLTTWQSDATPSQMAAVAKLVRMGGWANSQWPSSGMGSGS